jgi:hypothetical protein
VATREEDIQTVCKAVLDRFDIDDNSMAGSHCLFCGYPALRGLSEIEHDVNCPVLIAKDLRAGA